MAGCKCAKWEYLDGKAPNKWKLKSKNFAHAYIHVQCAPSMTPLSVGVTWNHTPALTCQWYHLVNNDISLKWLVLADYKKNDCVLFFFLSRSLTVDFKWEYMLSCCEWSKLKRWCNQPFRCSLCVGPITACVFCFQWVEYRKLDHAHGVCWSCVLCGMAASILGPTDQRGGTQDGCGTRLIHHHHQVGQLVSPFSGLCVWAGLYFKHHHETLGTAPPGVGSSFKTGLVFGQTPDQTSMPIFSSRCCTYPWLCNGVPQCVRSDSMTCMSLLELIGYPEAPAN